MPLMTIRESCSYVVEREMNREISREIDGEIFQLLMRVADKPESEGTLSEQAWEEWIQRSFFSYSTVKQSTKYENWICSITG